MGRGQDDVLILGAGLTGSSIALELARRGIPSTLIERDAIAMNRASLRNEGKIHLGLIYANDRSFETAFRQLEGALCFRSLITRWLGSEDWLARSTPFHYLVARTSIVPAERLETHYAAVEARCRSALAGDTSLDYLGMRPDRLTRRVDLDSLAAFFDPSCFSAAFATEEYAVDTDRLARSVREAIAANAAITLMPSSTVRTIEERPGGFRVGGDGRNGTWQVNGSQVVNATWEQRVALDQAIGLDPPDHLLHRLKFRVIARLPATLRAAPSVTMVLGRYGDLVVRADGTAYLSWYPVGLRGWTHDPVPPQSWDAACHGEVEADLAHELAASMVQAMADWCPAIAGAEPLLVDAGVVVAIGATDVDDSGSELHDRKRIGVSGRGGYFSVDPGKLTTAPLFAVEAADRIERARKGS
ncbi:MAG TPA: FAD-dependent oxidoreductase [Candidatus Udaeobacter sp.]|jgi:glycine/D-amino acid oxidase-like deaminating enzyme|nr:FAD-dependent oxidoreductase [Candidatus Udaeobacter sp.]